MDKNFIKFYEERYKEYWDYPLFSDYRGAGLKYKDVASKIMQFHFFLEKIGVRRGDKVAICGKNSSNWALTYFSVISYGAVIVPILDDFNSEDIQHIVNHAEAKLLFVDSNIYDKLDDDRMNSLYGIISLKDFELFSAKNKHFKKNIEKYFEEAKEKFSDLDKKDFSLPDDIDNEDLAAIVYTSGTSGFSKGVMLPYRSLAINVKYSRENFPLKPGDRMLSFLPLAHAYGCAIDFLFPMSSGTQITFLGKIPSPKVLLAAFSEIKPRLINSVPLIMEKIYKKQIKPLISGGIISSATKFPFINKLIYRKILKTLNESFGGNFLEIIVGGAAFNKETEEFFTKIGLFFTTGYGMTECGPLISYAPHDKRKIGSVGKKIDYIEVKIDSPDPVNISGEILVKGPNVMLGYFKNEEVTAEVLDNEGWLHTGDLGVIDEDGYIFIMGRAKNMFLGPAGQNIYPEEIEAKLNSLSSVSESLVLEKDGKIVALVYPDYDYIDKTIPKHMSVESYLKIISDNIKKEVNSKLASFSKINDIVIHPEPFEKTPTKKIKRFLYKI